MLTLIQWCLQITLNTVESQGHECSFLLGTPKKKPVLQHQPTIDSSLLESLVPSVSVEKSSPSASPNIPHPKPRERLTEGERRTAESAGSDKVKGQVHFSQVYVL